jgi:CRP-like cAMP-binding protein
MQELLSQHPELFAVLNAKVAANVRKMTFQRSLLGLPNIAQRVCCQLWLLVSEKEKTKEEAVIRNPPTHMEIAIMLNISRETVTRVFQSLQNRQIVRREGTTSLIVSQVDELRAFAEGEKEL